MRVRISRIVPMIPQILPAWVVPRPLGSMVPASISLRSPAPITQAAMASGRTNDQTENAENENKSAAMWFHN